MRRTGAISLTCLALAVVAGGCNHDGRTLRPAGPDQNASISTTAAPTTTLGGDFSSIDGGGLSTTSPNGSATTTTSAGAPVDGATVDDGTVTAPWRDGAAIDARYTCSGDDVSPPLSWSAAPAGTTEIAITMADEQASTFVHWAVAGIEPGTTAIQEGLVPPGAIQAVNGSGQIGYTGPCPPQSETHTYVITVHYLGSQIELGDGAAGEDMLLAIDAATLSSAQVTGTFARA
ncbi:MAG: YbhB/YbcL family Raf kinase inhibitor-like protein [Ilumatobacteraceae bacterium]